LYYKVEVNKLIVVNSDECKLNEDSEYYFHVLDIEKEYVRYDIKKIIDIDIYDKGR